MKITREQQIFLLAKFNRGQPGLWYGACKAKGWDPQDKELRLRVLSQIVGHPLASSSDIERITEFTKVKNELLIMQGVSLQAGIEGSDTTANDARVLRNQILTEIIPCLELYVSDIRGYLTEIMADKNRWWKIDRPVRDITVMDLDARPIIRPDKQTGEPRQFPSQLKQLQFTLSARLNEKRKKAGHTIHQMRLAAGLQCYCTKCVRRRPVSVAMPKAEVPF